VWIVAEKFYDIVLLLPHSSAPSIELWLQQHDLLGLGKAGNTQKHLCGFVQLWVDVGSPATANSGPSLSGYNEKPG
jgi:hypothetical protein